MGPEGQCENHGEGILMFSRGVGRNGRGELGGRHTWGNQHLLFFPLPSKVFYRLTWNSAGATHMQQEQDTESPGEPHDGAACAQQGACSRKQSPG